MGDKNDMLEYLTDLYSDGPEEFFSRASKDPTVSAFDQQLLDLCSAFEFSFVNCLCKMKLESLRFRRGVG